MYTFWDDEVNESADSTGELHSVSESAVPEQSENESTVPEQSENDSTVPERSENESTVSEEPESDSAVSEQPESDSAVPETPEEEISRPEGYTEIGALESILFSMGDPVELNRLAEAIDKTPKETRALLETLRERYQSEDCGIQLLQLDNAYQLSTKKEYYETLIRIAKHPKKPNLTDVMMETLSIIAYKQPVTRSEIEKIRGVSCEHAVNRLMEYELIQELGRLQVPGRPILLGTTDKFLRYFGLDSTDELPVLSAVELEDFKAEAEAELQISVDV